MCLPRVEAFFGRMALDLETYAHHAKRKTIEVADVELLLRRSVVGRSYVSRCRNVQKSRGPWESLLHLSS